MAVGGEGRQHSKGSQTAGLGRETGPGSQPSLDGGTRHLGTAASTLGPELSALQGSCHGPPTR